MIITTYKTDVGIKKSVNQDSLIIKKAATDIDDIVLIAVCDGMGGLSDGELASAEAVKMLNDWFMYELPDLMREGLSDYSFKESISARIADVNRKIEQYGEQNNIECGTTISAVLIYNDHYATVNIGDSRIYKLTPNSIEQLTHDQSVVQELLDKGEITAEEAETHPQRSTLLQCVGFGGEITPDFTFGSYNMGDVFLACSDGFRHKMTAKEMHKLFNPVEMTDKADMTDRADFGVHLNKERLEKDNITVVLCRT